LIALSTGPFSLSKLISGRNISVQSLAIGILIVVIAGMVVLLDNDQTQAQQQPQETAQGSVQHTAKGHESHQVVHLQNVSEGTVYKGTVTFNSSKPVDIIAYEDITGQTFNGTGKVWDMDGKQYAAKTLMTNATDGTVNFQGAGILTHAASSDPYQVTFSINANPISTNNKST
jgi:hypothetical protein